MSVLSFGIISKSLFCYFGLDWPQFLRYLTVWIPWLLRKIHSGNLGLRRLRETALKRWVNTLQPNGAFYLSLEALPQKKVRS